MKVLRTLRNYVCYCGIEKDKYNALKKDVYVSNFKVWRILHIFMAVAFGALFFYSLLDPMFRMNLFFYLGCFLYSVLASVLFFFLRKDSIAAQLIIYLSISVLFLFGCLITQNKPELPAITFIVMLLVTPMFMIDKPFFMAIELTVASVVFLSWMKAVKDPYVWKIDVLDVVIFTVVGIFLHIVANSIRINEFVLTKKINLQKDTDELTGIKNKGALTREINRFLADNTAEKGTLFLLDLDHFKSINDNYGHDTGDSVIRQLGGFLAEHFKGDEIVGRFGGDEFLVFIKNSDDRDEAARTASAIISGVSDYIEMPDPEKKVGLCIGIALFNGQEKNYSEIFKKADVALYKAKAEGSGKYCFFE